MPCTPYLRSALRFLRDVDVVELRWPRSDAHDTLTCYPQSTRSNRSVTCDHFPTSCIDADVLTWAVGTDGIESPRMLRVLALQQHQGLLRPSAVAVVIFDKAGSSSARHQWRELAPLAVSHSVVPVRDVQHSQREYHHHHTHVERAGARSSARHGAAHIHLDATSEDPEALAPPDRSSGSAFGALAGESPRARDLNATVALFRVSDFWDPDSIDTQQQQQQQPFPSCSTRYPSPTDARRSRETPSTLPSGVVELLRTASHPSTAGQRPSLTAFGAWSASWQPFDELDTRCVRGCDMVVAQCDEQLEWLVAEAPRYRRIFIYLKCGSTAAQLNPSFLSLRNVQFLPSPNIGSNDYAIVQHLVRMHGSLADITVFCEGGEHHRCSPDAIVRHESRTAAAAAAAVGATAPSSTSTTSEPTRERAHLPNMVPSERQPQPSSPCQRSSAAHLREVPHPEFRTRAIPYTGFMSPGPRARLAAFRFKRNYKFLESNRSFMMLRSPYPDFGTWLTDLVGARAALYLLHNSTQVASTLGRAASQLSARSTPHDGCLWPT